MTANAPENINQRFAYLIQQFGLTKNGFAMSLDKTASVIQHLIDGRNKPGYDLLCKVFEVYPNVSRDWLMLGQGPMLLTAKKAAVPVPAAPEETVEEVAPVVVPPAPDVPAPVPVATMPAAGPAPEPPAAWAIAPETYLTAALQAQQLQHQLALAELQNQHLLAQQVLLREMLELARKG